MPAIRLTARSRVAAVLLAAALTALAAPVGAQASDALKQGSRGPLVTELQRKLDIPADGVFGPQTARAVRRYQARKKLTVDGIVGPRTADALGLSLVRAGSAGAASPGGERVAPDRRPPSLRLPAVLQKIAACESGGNPRAVSADGAYRGKYQFTRGTWRAMGGDGDPAHASEREQDRRALTLWRARGTAPWPSCA